MLSVGLGTQCMFSKAARDARVLMSLAGPYQLWLRTHSHLAEVDGEDGMRAGALGVHLCAGGGAGQSAQLQTLQELWRTYRCECDRNIYCSVYSSHKSFLLYSSSHLNCRLKKINM